MDMDEEKENVVALVKNSGDQADEPVQPQPEAGQAPPANHVVITRTAREESSVWVDEQGCVWADVEIRGRADSVEVRSMQFQRWLRDTLRARGYPPPKKAAVTLAVEELDSWGAMQGPQFRRRLRVAHHEGRIYLDLANDAGEVVEITPEGWRVIPCAPVRFMRGASTLALPHPVRGGSVELLRPLVNASVEEHWVLMAGFLVGCFGTGPFPVLCLQGQHARGKSTTMEVLRSVVDPDRVTRASRPRSVRDLMVAGQRRWVLSYDNLSGLSPDLSDALCVLATGGAAAERRLYTNSEEVIHERMAPTMCSGIDDIATRGDLVRRAIILDLPRLHAPSAEASLRAQLREVRPRVLGALLDAVSMAMKGRGAGSPTTTDLSMVDHVEWVEGAASSLGWNSGHYGEVYAAMQRTAYEREIDRDPVARALHQRVTAEGPLVGTTTEVMAALDDRFVDRAVRASSEWPKGPRGFSDAIRRAAPALRALGVDADQGTGRARRTWTIRPI